MILLMQLHFLVTASFIADALARVSLVDRPKVVSPLPTVWIQTSSCDTDTEKDRPANVLLTKSDITPIIRESFASCPTDLGEATIRVRGSSSGLHPKKSYRLEFQHASRNDRKVSLLGIAKESDWVLYAGYTD